MRIHLSENKMEFVNPKMKWGFVNPKMKWGFADPKIKMGTTFFFRVWPYEAGRLYVLGIGDDYSG